ncbi:endolytic transglycosylase MltG [Jannaschia sp. R86511]|uniref:endolytic transglycosylase MltG n=1 Tax=Jannaschia sp. R86511 TaxID=3093853 RepID=UPI0036D3C736
MTYRDPGGSPTSGDGATTDADLDQLRRTSPRRAARIEAERARGGVAAAPGAVPVTPAADQPFDQYAPEPGHGQAYEPTVRAYESRDPAPGPVQDHTHDQGPDAHATEHAQDHAEHPYDHAPGYAPDHAEHPYDHAPGYAPDHAEHPDAHAHDHAEHAHEPAAEPVHDHAHEPVHDYAHEPAYAGAAPYAEHHFDEPHHDDAFGDPVSDGYVSTAAFAPPPRRRPRWVGLLALVMTVGVVGVAGWFAYQGLRPVIADIQGVELFAGAEDFEGSGTGSVEVVVAPGDTGREMGQTLLDAGVVASVEAFVEAANADPRFTSVQPGTYTVAQQLPAADAVAALVDPANRETNTVVVAEGLRVDQALERLAEGTGLPLADLEAAVAAAELPPAAGAEGVVDPAEGFLYPDGYQFGDDPTAQEVVDTMIARGQEVLAELGVAPEDQLEVLTKASLVQGEARLDEDFGRVAQVVDNRLAIDQPLGLDSTVNYATQTFDTRTTAEQRDSDSPYNTYRFPGLPPGPIKSPGRQAIEAVVSPTPGPWLYFVTVDLCTGETAFAETFEEHQANVQVLNAWQRENTADDGSLICG